MKKNYNGSRSTFKTIVERHWDIEDPCFMLSYSKKNVITVKCYK